MSSSIHIYYRHRQPLSTFEPIFEEIGLKFEGAIIGQDTFGIDSTEVILGNQDNFEIDEDGIVRYHKPHEFTTLYVSTTWHGDLTTTFSVAKAICEVSSDFKICFDDEYKHFFESHPELLERLYDEDLDDDYGKKLVKKVEPRTNGGILTIETNLTATASCLEIKNY